MYLDIREITEGVIMVEGKMPAGGIMKDGDIANSVIFRSDENVYLIDTGATLSFKEALKRGIDKAIGSSKVKIFYLLNSHAHIDHVGNNDLIRYPSSEKHFHFIHGEGLQYLDHMTHSKEQLKELGEFYELLEGPRPPYRILMRLLKITRIFGEDLQFKIIIGRVISKFNPVDVSMDTISPFPNDLMSSLIYGKTSWSGWNLNDEVHVLESGGHTPDSVIFYFPSKKTIVTADETFEYFCCWPISKRRNVRSTLSKCIEMAEQGFIDFLISGHHHDPVVGSYNIVKFLKLLLDMDDVFVDNLIDILKREPGLTINEIYKRLKKRKNNEYIKKYFSIEFPVMPPILKNIIISTLLEVGIRTDGKRGKKRFYLLEK